MRRERVCGLWYVVGSGASERGGERGGKEAGQRGIKKADLVPGGRTKGHFSVLKVSLIGCLCLNFSENGGNKISSHLNHHRSICHSQIWLVVMAGCDGLSCHFDCTCN